MSDIHQKNRPRDLRPNREPRVTRAFVLAAAVASLVLQGRARAGSSVNTTDANTNPGQNDSGPSGSRVHNFAVTVSFSGQTAFEAYYSSPAPSLLTPGQSITLHNGTGGAAVTYTAPAGASTSVQLARSNFGSADDGVNDPTAITQNHSALRTEWKKQGSVEGLIDLVNDQIGYAGASVSAYASRGPSSANPIYVNTQKFIGVGYTGSDGLDAGANPNQLVTKGKHALSASGGAAYYDTYSGSVYDLATGTNQKNGQNRVQVAIGEYRSEAFSVTGAAAVTRKAGDAGYGKGNPALPSNVSLPSNLGTPNGSQALKGSEVVNFDDNKVDPQSTTSQTYGQKYGTSANPWKEAGAANIDSRPIAVSAVGFVANPGTGLRRVTRSDSAWLQTTGRLRNGADFNVVTREANTGQRLVFALNSGVDPSWAVGENDDGDSSLSAAALTQHNVGTGIRFSGKTSGSEVAKTIGQSRLGIGPLAQAETFALSTKVPVRTLDVKWSDADGYVKLNFDSISNLKYRATLISHFNTIKTPNPAALAAYKSANPTLTDAQAWAELRSWDPNDPASTTVSGIKGDNTGKDVRAVLANIAGAAATFPLPAGNPSASNVFNPADGLLLQGFLYPNLLDHLRVKDGDAQADDAVNPTYVGNTVRDDVKSKYGYKFDPEDAATLNGGNAQTIGYGTGASSARYGGANDAGVAPAIVGTTVLITAKDAAGNSIATQDRSTSDATPNLAPKGNWLFGNFNQDGRRDLSSVKEAVNAALSLRNKEGSDAGGLYAGLSVATAVNVNALGTSAAWQATAGTKGDLVTLGDFNTDGAFDGRDVYLLARGAALSDSTATDHLAGDFTEAVHRESSVLRKNDALDYAASVTAATANADQTFLRRTAETAAAQSADAATNYVNAFNKRDVNRDGRVDLKDAFVVDKFQGKDFKDLDSQLAATINADGGINATLAQQKQFSLVEAKLVDGSSVVGQADLDQLATNTSAVAPSLPALNSAGTDSWSGTITKPGTGEIRIARPLSGTVGGTLVTSSVTVAAGAKLVIPAGRGTFTAGGASDPFTDSAVTTRHLDVQNDSAGVAAATGGLNVSAGTKTVGAITGTGRTAVAAGATLAATAGVRQASLSIGGTATVPAGGGDSVVGTLTLAGGAAPTGKLDLTTNSLVVTYGTAASPRPTLEQQVVAGFTSGTAGILTTAGTPGGLTLGIADTADVPGATANGGGAIPAGSVVVRYTYAGDANLDGSVDTGDLGIMLDNFGALADPGGRQWSIGDVNYDASVDTADLGLALDNFGQLAGSGAVQAALAGLGFTLADGVETGVANGQAIRFALTGAALPEPASLGLLGVGAMTLLGRRRRARV